MLNQSRLGQLRHGLGALLGRRLSPRRSPRLAAPTRALHWLRSQELPTGGIRVHSRHPRAYQEVTGYLIPTLLDYGERALATRLTQWLVSVQAADGSYVDPDYGKPYVFDTAQALRGLLRGAQLAPGALEAARRAADYLCEQAVDGGATGFKRQYTRSISESIHLYALSPLREAAAVFHNPEYAAVADRCLEYYQTSEDTLNVGRLTHFLAYELEALIDLGATALATPVLDRLQAQQGPSGAVIGREGASWVCVPGLAQLAVCWYKTGAWEPADRAMSWLEGHQQPSGGFRGGFGPGATYFPHVEIAWSAKYYLDAHRWRVRSYFDRSADQFPDSAPEEDGRAQAILKAVPPGAQALEVGCGKGRFLKLVAQARPDVQCTGVDISPVMLAALPPTIQTAQGGLEAIPYPDDDFDVVFSVEAIEHSANVEAAIAEMVRVARPGGWVIIIDKHQGAWGRFRCPPWERWPRVADVRALLEQGCDDVTAEPVGYDGKTDGLMVVWQGRKRGQNH